jgi:predicted PurR-regulated permease PerM
VAGSPGAAKTLSRSLQKYVRPGALNEMKKAAVELESVAQTGKSTPAPAPAAPSATAQVSMLDVVWKGGKGVLLAATQSVAVLFLVFFMLASGDLFKKKIVALGRSATRSASPCRCSTTSTARCAATCWCCS